MRKLLICPGLEPERLARILAAAGAMEVVNAESEAEALGAVVTATGFIGKITRNLLAAARQLEWVQAPTASLEHYMFPELVAHPCTLTNMRGLFNDIIADQVMGYVICFARNLHTYIQQQTRRQWQPVGGESAINFVYGPGRVTPLDLRHQHLSDQSVGIIGLGSIGGEIARRALAFGLRVTAVDPVRTEAPEGVALRGLEATAELLKESDYVVIAAPHTPQTEGSFGMAQLAMMKPTAYFINIGRGAIVKLDDLCAALDRKLIAGAALDVYEKEPLPAEHPLWAYPNVILTPHIAGYSPRIAQRHLAVLVDNVSRHATGEPLRNIVRKSEWF
jgi:phosphoglycerate dehydrogenase-like enzyme